jgi:NADPH-dependent ferric siderophore reductase
LRNQSALVPIIHSAVSIERVSLWNGRGGARPVRALWVANTSGLTLDAGAFTVIEDGVFAGEGLVELLKPDEKRLLSYAIDLGVQVDSKPGSDSRVVSRIVAQRGVIVQQAQQRTRRVYTIRNNDTAARTVLIEHPTHAGWTLANSVHPVETTTDAYRFSIPTPPKQTVTFTVDETRPLETRYEIASMTDSQMTVLVRDSGDNRTVMDALAPILAKKAAIAAIMANVATRDNEMKQISSDQQRIRENLQSLKDIAEQRALVKRFAAQLTQQEDRLEVLRREIADLHRAFEQAKAELQQLVEQLAIDLNVEQRASS